MHRVWDKSKPPTGPFTLNNDAWQAQGLVCWYPWAGPGAGYDLLGTNHHVVTAVPLTRDVIGAPVGVFNGSTSLLQSPVVPVYAAPLTIGCWFYKTLAADTVNYGLAAFGDYTLMVPKPRRFQFDTYNGSLRFVSVGASIGVASKSGIITKKWHHGLGIEVSTASRYVALDGTVGTQDTTSATPGGTQNRFVLGALFNNGSNEGLLNGCLGETCLWNISQLSNAAALADPGQRFALWYPLRSKKWISIAAGGSFQPAWAARSTQMLGVGIHA